jgi:hypothetical protein
VSSVLCFLCRPEGLSFAASNVVFLETFHVQGYGRTAIGLGVSCHGKLDGGGVDRPHLVGREQSVSVKARPVAVSFVILKVFHVKSYGRANEEWGAWV